MIMGLPPLNALRAFEAAARLQSMSLAAHELCVTHGAVSRQVRLLEEQLGVALFSKDGRGVKLTDAGLRLRDSATEAFTRLRTACTEIQQQTREAPFVLACSGSLLARWFIPRLDRLNRELPDLRLQLSVSDLELDPKQLQADAMLCFASPPWPADMQVQELAVECIGPVLSPQHPRFAELAKAPAERVLNEQLLHTTSRPQAWPQWLALSDLSQSRLQLGQSFDHLYYLLEAAVAGLGIAIAPRQLVADDLAAGRLLAPWGFVETPSRLSFWSKPRGSDPRAERLLLWLGRELKIPEFNT
jgi:DNA-binding transcriptional LysR family regulator